MQKLWKILDPAPTDFLSSHPELPSLVANLLYHRKLTTQAQIDEFLNPDYSQDIHDPFLFKDMEKACERIIDAIEKQEKIVVHGDYDADGVSSSVILISTLKELGAEHCEVFLPHREIDGYGLNKFTVQMLSERKTNLIITCDCGVSNNEEIKLAKELGMDVIVTDHHTVPAELPPAFAIIHPLVPDETYPDKGLCGGGVSFKLMQGLLKYWEKIKVSAQGVNPRPMGLGPRPASGWEKWMLDMAAIASVADMVPLLGESRTLTKYGLIVLNKTKRLGLQKLLLEARLLDEKGFKKREFDTRTIGFQIAPRINAAGRMNHANAAYNLLMTDNAEEAALLAHELDESNQKRQKITEELVKRAVEQIETKLKDDPVLIVEGAHWPPGIVGLISGKLKDKYYKPTLVATDVEGELLGSGRSIDEFNLIKCLQGMPEMFAKFGGHPMACGFTLAPGKTLDELRKKMSEKFLEETAGMDVRPKLNIDTEIKLDDIDWELYDLLQKFEPFGQNNEEPKYLARELTVKALEPVGKEGKHLRIMVQQDNGQIKKTIGWDLCNENNCHCLDWSKELKVGDKIDMVFEIEVNEWNGNRELQLTIADLKKI